jgi:hypothetical protein
MNMSLIEKLYRAGAFLFGLLALGWGVYILLYWANIILRGLYWESGQVVPILGVASGGVVLGVSAIRVGFRGHSSHKTDN